MIKSAKEMKNNNIHHSNLLKPPIKCRICKYIFPGLAILSERNDTPMEGFEPSQK